jgi:hypothetical protein
MRATRFGPIGVTLTAWLTAACPGPLALQGRGTSHSGGGPGAGDVIAFAVQPSTAIASQIITPAIQVAVRDSLGIPDSSFTGNVTIAIGTNPGGGTLSGTGSVAAVNGVALFGDLSIDRAGNGYTLNAQANGMSSVTSASFNITQPATTAAR